ncbi:MAG: hypothetical protein HPY73_06600 [Methanomassiliicoccales archaeon]|nr:MAG: hypothetical protein HPY73_06600 [Methanomassiliicoccales archaeon]
MTRIVMRTRYERFDIELNETDTANAVYLSLPLTREVNVWGGEIYFPVPVDHPLENGKKVMDVGEVAFWPEGNAFCIFFGRTPFSRGEAPEAYGPVTPIGKVISNIERLEGIADKTEITLDRS